MDNFQSWLTWKGRQHTPKVGYWSVFEETPTRLADQGGRVARGTDSIGGDKNRGRRWPGQSQTLNLPAEAIEIIKW